jgi:D-glycero-D-manno-heptose 1,7-bisphosphate phosphatase
VINALVPDRETGQPESPLQIADVVLLEGVPAAMRELAEDGFLLIGISNQPAAAKETATREQLALVQARVLELLADEDARLDDFRICLHHPDGSDTQLGRACDCRKPAPGMLLDAARTHDIDLARSWMVGDTDADVRAGAAAGTRTVLVDHHASAHKRDGSSAPTLVALDLPHAVRRLLATAGR